MKPNSLAQIGSGATDRPFAIPTRDSLLSRLRNSSDDDSWREFYSLYSAMILNAALRRGLTKDEAAEVLQETMIALTKALPTFKYDRRKGTFKSWLMKVTHWRILNQVRKRIPEGPVDLVEELEAPSEFQMNWDKDWEMNVYSEALKRTKLSCPPENYQVFHTAVVLGKGPKFTARLLDRSVPAVYIQIFRIKNEIRNHIRKLQRENF